MKQKNILILLGLAGVVGVICYFLKTAPSGAEDYHTIHLIGGEYPEGWNDIVYDGKSGDVVELTSNIINLSRVYYWDGSDWFYYNPVTGGQTLYTLEYGKQYQIHTTTTQDWEVPNP